MKTKAAATGILTRAQAEKSNEGVELEGDLSFNESGDTPEYFYMKVKETILAYLKINE